MPTQPASLPSQSDLQLEIAHLLLVDIVGYSKLLVNEQIEAVQELTRVARSTESFQNAQANGKLIRVPTGDGMILVFFASPEEPARCALEIARKFKENSSIRLRMGIHSGPVNRVQDVNDTLNVAGTGINVAQRIMDCGDAGHILVSKRVADDLAQYRDWKPHLHDFGECEVKHGLRVHIVNLCKDDVGNPSLPEKLRRRSRWKQNAKAAIRPVTPSRAPTLLVILAAFTVIALGISVSIYLRRGSATTASQLDALGTISAKSVAVLPFEDLSDEKENAYFTDGVQDEILTDLSKVADLKVISRTSVMQYRSAPGRSVREIAKQLGVANIVEGTVQRSGNRVRVSAQLINARTDAHVWAEHYDRELADIFALESELAQQIVSKLKAKLSPKEKAAMEEPPTKDLAAYELYLRGKKLIDGIIYRPQQKQDLLEAVQLLESAVTHDSEFLRAYYYLARAHDLLYFLGLDHTATRLEMAKKAAETALRLRPDSGEAHLALAQHLYSGYRDYDGARKQIVLAQNALPSEPLVFQLAGLIDRRQGRWDQAISDWKRAAELDPRNISILHQLSITYESLRQFKEAKETLERILVIAPDDINAQVARAFIDLEWHATLAPLQQTIQSIVTKNPNAAEEISATWLFLALNERDGGAAEQALGRLPKDGCNFAGIPFPRAWCEGLTARLRGDKAAAHDAFLRARNEVEQIVHAQPDYAEALCALGMIDAALGRKAEAIQEGRRAVELCPLTTDASQGALLIEYLAVIYAWTGEKQSAVQQLETAVRIPAAATYGDLRLHPYWDPLRGDPRFEKIVSSLAPDAKKP